VSPSKPCRSSGPPAARFHGEYVEAYASRADARRRAGDVQGARSDLEKALSMDPDNASALLLRGASSLQEGHPGRAIRDFTRILSRNGCNTAACFRRGEARQSMGHFRAALSDFTRVLLLEQDHREALIHRALLYAHYGEVDRALADFNRLMSSDPRIARALANWGVRRFLKAGR